MLTILGYTWYFFIRLTFRRRFRYRFLDSYEDKDKDRFLLFQMSVSAHLAFVLLVGGLWLNPSNFFVQVGIFIGSAVGGGSLPFLVLVFKDSGSSDSGSSGPADAQSKRERRQNSAAARRRQAGRA